MKSSMSFRFSSVFFFFFILFIVAAIAEDSNAEEDCTDLQAVQCVYAVSVQTGTITNAGTDSRISLKLTNGYNGQGSSFDIPDLKSWGLMLPGHDYFENGNLDFFVGRGPCLNPPQVCRMTVTSDGTGTSPAWYLEYVDITTIGPNYTYRYIFRVDQWLATSSAPYQLSTTRDYCGVISEGGVEAGLNIAKV